MPEDVSLVIVRHRGEQRRDDSRTAEPAQPQRRRPTSLGVGIGLQDSHERGHGPVIAELPEAIAGARTT